MPPCSTLVLPPLWRGEPQAQEAQQAQQALLRLLLLFFLLCASKQAMPNWESVSKTKDFLFVTMMARLLLLLVVVALFLLGAARPAVVAAVVEREREFVCLFVCFCFFP